MDLFVQSYTNNAKEPIIDFEVTGKGELSVLSGEAEVSQRAVVASFLQKGTIPQLPNTGVEWAEMLVGQVSPAEVNSQIMKQIHECADTYSYLPKYSSLDNRIVVSIEQGA